jgi:hypothetical protein
MEAEKPVIEKNLLTIKVLEAVEKSDSCPLCYLWLKHESRHLKYLLTNEVTMDPGFREKVLSSRGFCNRHTHLLYEAASGVGTEDGLGYSLYMQSVVEEICHGLKSLLLSNIEENTACKGTILRWWRRRQAITLMAEKASKAYYGEGFCPVCESLWTFDQIYLYTLLQMLDDKDFREEFKTKWLCLPHFLSALRLAGKSNLESPAEVIHTLVEIEVSLLERLSQLLSESIRKHDWRFRDEPRGPETEANSLALSILAGVEGLYSCSLKAYRPCVARERLSRAYDSLAME